MTNTRPATRMVCTDAINRRHCRSNACRFHRLLAVKSFVTMFCYSWAMVAVLLHVFLVSFGDAFALWKPLPPMRHRSTHLSTVTCLSMGKGLNRARNKQADLARKLELARQQNKKESSGDQEEEETNQNPSTLEALSEMEIKKRNDRLRFEELLKRESSNVLNEYSKDGYLSQEQEEEEISAVRSGADRLFEGDPAPPEAFEELVSITSGNAICKRGAAKLVPWLHKNEDRHVDYMIVLTDPRMKSPELRQAAKSLLTELPVDLLQRMIVVNVDSPAENRRWLKRNGLLEETSTSPRRLQVYSDEKMEWMRAYTALGEKRFSMCVFVLAKGRVQKLAREVDGMQAGRVIQNAVKSLDG